MDSGYSFCERYREDPLLFFRKKEKYIHCLMRLADGDGQLRVSSMSY